MSEVIDTLKSVIEETSAQITLASNLPTVAGDRSLLKRIFTNLLGNAIMYRRLQTVPIIQVDSLTDTNYAIIRVIDNGIGISPEFREKSLISSRDYIVRKSIRVLELVSQSCGNQLNC